MDDKLLMGSVDHKVASADRLREQRDKVRIEAEKRQQGIANAIANIKDDYREPMDSSEIEIGKTGVKAKAPPWALLSICALALVAFVSWLFLRK